MIELNSALLWAEEELKEIDSFEARILLADILSIPSYFLPLYKDKKLGKDQWRELRKKIEKRKNFYPLQYLRGFQPFLLWNFKVDKNVFIPRQETEVLVEYVFKLNLKKRSLILDMCCGTGVIGISLAKFFPESKVYAVDISPAALKVARENAENIGAKNIIFFEGDLFKPLKNLKIKFDLIISNPPYIPEKEWEILPEDVKREPKRSLIGGRSGILFHKKILSQSAEFLKRDGFVILEIGISQKEKIKTYAEEKGFKIIDIIFDYQNMERGLVLTKNLKN